jgi:TusA-related sulfurtransferase
MEVFFMAKYDVTKTLDVMGEVCPVPDVDTKRALKKMKSGEILEVLIDYPMSKERIPETVEKMGHEVLEIEEIGNSEWKIYIKVK